MLLIGLVVVLSNQSAQPDQPEERLQASRPSLGETGSGRPSRGTGSLVNTPAPAPEDRSADRTPPEQPARTTTGRVVSGPPAPAIIPVQPGEAAPAGHRFDDDMVFYFGGAGDQRLEHVVQLSDGTFLISGSCSNLDWVPQSAERITLTGPMPECGSGDRIPMLVQMDPGLTRILRVVSLPLGSAMNFNVVRTTNIPGQATGLMFVGGERQGVQGQIHQGYFIARLDGNFVDKVPSQFEWLRDIRGTGHLAGGKVWDVGPDGKVILATGDPHGYNWMAVERLTADGEQDVVENWRIHVLEDEEGALHEWTGSPASAGPGTPVRSMIVLKIWGRGDFRSHNREDFLLRNSDGNGGYKQGKWPLDAMFPGYFDPETKKTVQVLEGNRGYYGYRWGNTPNASVGAIVIDRRNGQFYIGGNNKSVLPDPNPDFEPWLVAMDASGGLKWWQRLYSEEKGVSTPDQYIDELAIDYSVDWEIGGAITVVARSHGNNINNFWQGDQVVDPANPGHSFQNQFTGTLGNIHFSWLGRLSLDEGRLLHASYFAEYGEGANHGGRPFSEPLLSHWPHFLSGWPNLNTTRVRPGGLTIDQHGRVYVAAMGRRVITTANAFMEMPSPLRDRGSRGHWSDFVRVYRQDLTTLDYSSILSGTWDWQTGDGGGQIRLSSVLPVNGGLVTVGYTSVDRETRRPRGNDIPRANQPPWAPQERQGEMGIIAVKVF